MNDIPMRGSLVPASPIASGGTEHLAGEALPPIARYLSILRRRKWLVLGTVVGALLLGLLATMLMTPKYTAWSTIEIQRETRNFTNVEGAEPEQASTIDQEFYETQYGLLKSKSLADRVATQMRLYDNPAFFDMFGVDTDGWFQNGRPVRGATSREQRIREAGRVLQKNIIVSPERLSRLVNIAFTSPDASFSRKVIDAWGANFIQSTLERRFEATSYARSFLERRLTQLRARIDQSERELVTYAAREGIINLPSATSGDANGASGERSLAADDLATFNRSLAQSTADRVAAQSRVSGSGGTVSEALQNDAITGLRQRRAELSGEYAKLMVQFEPDYPPARALQNQIEQIDRSITREESRVSNTLQQTYRAAVAREQGLAQRVEQLKTGVLDLRRRSIQYNVFQREVDTNRQLYDALLQRYKEIGVAGGVGVNNISIVDAPEVPDRPSSPRLLLNMAVALLAGLVLGAGAALAREQIDEAIADPSEVEALLGLSLLGTIPRAAGLPIEELNDRKSELTEAYLSLQTNLAFTTDHGVPRTLAITSTRPAEGKSTTSYALARSLARGGKRTLLIDADMRSPSVHGEFAMANGPGLSNYLAGHEQVETLYAPTTFDNLSVMTAGPQPPNAAELLAGERLRGLLDLLGGQFDQIVLDAPPVMGLADAPLIGSVVEGTIFVLESHGTRKSMARVAVSRLRAANTQLAGAVLAKFDAKRAHYGYGYNYGYGYSYGDKK